MLRTQLKSKIHLARVTAADLNCEGSITVPEDLMRAVDLWPGEHVQLVSRNNGSRLWTYVQPGPGGSGAVVVNGAAARLVHEDDRVTLTAFGQSERPIVAKRVVVNEHNEVVRSESGVQRVSVPRETIAF